MSCDAADFRAAMRGLASGVSLVTTRDTAGMAHGMAATAVTSISAEPPRLLVCVNKSASMHAPLLAAGIFAVNFLTLEQEPLVALFSSPKDRAQRFAGPDWGRLETGAPVLAGAIAALDCRVVETIEASSHTMIIGDVVATRALSAVAVPLVHYHGGLGAFAAAA